MRKTAFVLGILFLLLTFAGGVYVIANHGEVNAGYAVIPSFWCIVCFGLYRRGNDRKHT